MDAPEPIDRQLLAASLLGVRQARDLIGQGREALEANAKSLSVDERADLEDLAARLEEEGVQLIGLGDHRFPSGLRDLTSPPPFLFTLGDLSLLSEPMLAFSGSRDASEQVLEATSTCATVAGRMGFTVSAGFARGVDTAAHEAALLTGTGTVAILPEGILSRRFRLSVGAREVLPGSEFLAVSQFPAEARWSVGRAMARNSTLVVTSLGLVVMAAGDSGGSLEAGRTALRSGRTVITPVFSGLPGPGVSILVQDGAMSVRSESELIALFETIGEEGVGEPEGPPDPDTLF